MSDVDRRRFDELETKAAFQEDLLAQLDEALYRQQARIDELERAVERLSKAITNLTPPEDPDPASQRPPHW